MECTPNRGEFLRSAAQINLLNGTLSECFLSGQSNSAVFELKPVEARHISGFSLLEIKEMIVRPIIGANGALEHLWTH